MIRYFFSREFLEFLFVGGIAASINWSSRYVLSWWFPFAAAVVVAYCIATIVAFLLNKRIVFPKSGRPLGKQARDFMLTNLALLPLVCFTSIMMPEQLTNMGVVHYTEELAHAIAIATPVFITFLIYKLFVFKVESS